MNSPIQDVRSQESYPEDEHRSRDMELVLAKLDAVKAELDSVHQRIRKIEQSTDSRTTRKYNW